MPAKEHYFMDYKVKLQLGNRGNYSTWLELNLPLRHKEPLIFTLPLLYLLILGNKGWRSGESRLASHPWPGFKSRRRRHLWVEFVIGFLLCSERFFSGYCGFPLSSKTNASKFQFDQESNQLDEEPLCGCATSKSLFIIYLIIRRPL